MGKPRTGMYLQQQLGQINAGQPGLDVLTQGEEARWLLEFVETGQRQRVAALDLFNADSGIRGKIGRRAVLGHVQLLPQRLQCRLR